LFDFKLLNLLRYFSALLLACLLGFAMAAQQAGEQGSESPETATSDDATKDDAVADDAAVNDAVTDDSAETAEDLEDIEDADLDEQTYEQDDDDFIPTEEIPADEPIPFPSNI
jgi:hypothetical protein